MQENVYCNSLLFRLSLLIWRLWMNSPVRSEEQEALVLLASNQNRIKKKGSNYGAFSFT